jgi:FtsP/CotA-like multicopper oxidase with cupredoxin domain
MEDTINVAIHQTIRLRLIPDNPGHWMVHCHILPHADEGMMTVINIEGEHPHGSMSR